MQRKNCLRCRKPLKARKGQRRFCSVACRTADRAAKRACLHCGQPRPSPRRIFCSVACRRARDAARRKPCKYCGKPVDGYSKRYCDATCREASFARKRACPTCGNPRLPGRRYCSKACRPLVKQDTCINCGKPHRNEKYCSLACQQELRAAQPPAPPPARSCPICKQPFRSFLNKYCSLACAGTARRKIHTCKSCGDKFTTLRSDNYEGRVYCKSCWQNRPSGGNSKPGTNPPGGWMREVNLELLAKFAHRRGPRRAARKFNLTIGQVAGWWHRHGKALVTSKRLC